MSTNPLDPVYEKVKALKEHLGSMGLPPAVAVEMRGELESIQLELDSAAVVVGEALAYRQKRVMEDLQPTTCSECGETDCDGGEQDCRAIRDERT